MYEDSREAYPALFRMWCSLGPNKHMKMRFVCQMCVKFELGKQEKLDSGAPYALQGVYAYIMKGNKMLRDCHVAL